ncbi:MAG: SDR family NAD(P)-dependent oxidoreductase [Polyangiales bacterium]
MAIRGSRVLVVGACSALGHRIVEAFLALGAQVIAADRLRTRLEELRADLRQHERLWVAETDPDDPQALAALFADVAAEPLDAALFVLPVARTDRAADAGTLGADLRSLPRCACFVRAALHELRRHGRGRVILLVEPASGPRDDELWAAVSALLADAAVRALPVGLSMCALRASATLAVEQALAAADPERPAQNGPVG